MKTFILFVAGLMAVVDAGAQRPDTAQVLVHYKFSQVRDTANRGVPFTENMVLAVGKHAGVYRSYDHLLSAAQDKKKTQEAVANSTDGNVMVNHHITGSGTEYFQYPNDKKMFRKESLFGSFLVAEALPVIKWQVIGDTASFGGLHCQKATCHFKGRDYTAWFCPDLPVSLGPWKLTGLPGVIVDAYDATGDVRFAFDGVEKVAFVAKADDQPVGQATQGIPPPLPGMEEESDPVIIKVPEKATKTTEAEFAKLQEAFRKDPNAFVQSRMAAQGGGMPGDGAPKTQINIKMRPQPANNNPIELPEKP
jgi:GLPGLI family protein